MEGVIDFFLKKEFVGDKDGVVGIDFDYIWLYWREEFFELYNINEFFNSFLNNLIYKFVYIIFFNMVDFFIVVCWMCLKFLNKIFYKWNVNIFWKIWKEMSIYICNKILKIFLMY